MGVQVHPFVHAHVCVRVSTYVRVQVCACVRVSVNAHLLML